MPIKSSANELRIERLYDAPIEAVWDAWADPDQAAKWWGPRGFTITTHSKSLKPGGTWVYTMHGPDGTDYPNKTYYHEVEPYAKLVYDHGASDESPPLFRVTVQFSKFGEKTKMVMTMTLPTPADADKTREFIRKAGGNATWDRLAEFIAERTAKKEIFVINRTFAAPVNEVFNLWIDPVHAAKWIPPIGFEMEYLRADIRPGGSAFYLMTGKDNFKMYGRMDYLKIEPNSRIVYTQQFSDENGAVSRHPMAPTWPETMLTVVDFNEEGKDHTRITVTWAPHGQVSSEELSTFIEERGGMTQGWTGSFDKLERYITDVVRS